jgi:phosphopantothenoylcysteine decarboxylase/phosphopantothenate--cysteine ligase
MNCIVTAGPTYESLDNVRRLTNFSTGRLGSELADFLVARGHQVTLLIGQQATYQGAHQAQKVEIFTTTADLSERLKTLSRQPVDAVFHAAAVSDFTFGKTWFRSASGEMTEVKSGKLSTRQGTLLAELVPTPKIIAQLRGWYPKARLVGWKFEVDGDRAGVIALAERQMADCRTDACVANGAAYGSGFGLVTGAGKCLHLADAKVLFPALEKFIQK